MTDIDNALIRSLMCLLGTRQIIQEQKKETQLKMGELSDGEGSGWVGIYEDLERWEEENSKSIEMVQKAQIAEEDQKKRLFQQIVESAIQTQKKAKEEAEKTKEEKITADRKYEATKSKSGKA